MPSHTIRHHKKHVYVSRAREIDIQRREPRCRICRKESLRVLVNQLLDWRGVPVRLGGGKIHRITYTDILNKLEPINEGRPDGDRITYNCLWVHAKRHYEVGGIAAYWEARMVKDLRNALRHSGTRHPAARTNTQ